MTKIMNRIDLEQIKQNYLEMEKGYKYQLHVCFGAGCISSNCKEVKDALVEALKKNMVLMIRFLLMRRVV